MSREPIFGPNAKPMLVQTVIGIVVAVAAATWLVPLTDPYVEKFLCTYITGSCAQGQTGSNPGN